MSNTIQIKHGSSVPKGDDLAAYELGYCTNENKLYIGQSSGDPKEISSGVGQQWKNPETEKVHGEIFNLYKELTIVKEETTTTYPANVASGNYSHAEGVGTAANGFASHAEGQKTTAHGAQSHAEGLECKAWGNANHVEGYNCQATGDYTHAEGASTIADGYAAHTEGNQTKAYGPSAHAEGEETQAGTESNPTLHAPHAEGKGTRAYGAASHAEGINTQAKGQASHAEGDAVDGYSNIVGQNRLAPIAYGRASHAEGIGTQAGDSNVAASNSPNSPSAAHAEGIGSQAIGVASHAEGFDTIASGKAQHVQGKYNIKDTEGKYAHIVGWGDGDSETQRKNIHTIDTLGNAWFAGNVTIGSSKDPLAKQSELNSLIPYSVHASINKGDGDSFEENFGFELAFVVVIAKRTISGINRISSGIWTPGHSGCADNMYGLYQSTDYRTKVEFLSDNKKVKITNETGADINYTVIGFKKFT